ncbi:MAG: SWIM zinc finger family protein [Bacteroidia bacterium]|nr:SWIM zinc finger family protein [Bacteroidia bacterium]
MESWNLMRRLPGIGWTAQLRGADASVLRSVFGAEIAARAAGIAVRSLHQPDPLTLRAAVAGTSPYEVQLHAGPDWIAGSCTCPYAGPCKHLAALLLHLAADPEQHDPLADPERFQALVSMADPEVLRALVLRFADAQLQRQMLLAAAPEPLQQALLRQAAGLIRLQLAEAAAGPPAYAGAIARIDGILQDLHGLWLAQADPLANLCAVLIRGLGGLPRTAGEAELLKPLHRTLARLAAEAPPHKQLDILNLLWVTAARTEAPVLAGMLDELTALLPPQASALLRRSWLHPERTGTLPPHLAPVWYGRIRDQLSEAERARLQAAWPGLQEP